MNLKALAQSAVATAFRVADSLLVSCYYRQGASAYSTGTGAVTPNYTLTAVNAMFTLFEAKESDSAAKREGERRVLVERTQLAGIVPTLADAFVVGDTVWQVVHIEDDKDSAEAMYAFIVKRGQA